MRWRWLPWVVTLALAHAVDASGAGVVSAPASAPTEATFVVAAAPSRTTRWVSLRLGERVDRAVVLVPVRSSARVDVGSTAFLDALDEATAPRIVPPPTPSPCGLTPSAPESHVAPVKVSREPTDWAWLDSPGAVAAYVNGWQIDLTSPTALRIEALANDGFHFVAAAYVSLDEGDTLAPLRVVDDAPAELPLFLLRAGERPVRVVAHAIGPGRASFGDAEMVTIEGDVVRFDRKGLSSYPKVRDEAIEAGLAKRWVVESAGHDSLFAATALPRSTRPIPSLVSAYLSRAIADEATALSCERAMAGLANRPERVGAACLPSLWAGEDCEEEARVGEIAADLFRCDLADDLALAFSGQRPSEMVLTRATSVLPAFEMGVDLPIAFSRDAEVSPVLLTSRYEACESSPGPGNGDDRTGGGSSDPWTPPPLENPGEEEVWEEDTAVDWAAIGCALTVESTSDESCDSDYGEEYETSDESCDSDYGEGYESDDESCDSDQGYDDSADEECAMTRGRRRPFRPRLSAYAVSLAAIALWARRSTRKRG